MQVTAQPRADHRATRHERDGGGRLQLREPIGHLTGGGLGGDERRRRADVGEIGEGAGGDPCGELAGRQGGETGGRAAVGADAARVPELALQEECDAFQGRDRVHLSRQAREGTPG